MAQKIFVIKKNLKKLLIKILLIKLINLKNFIIELQNFFNMCYEINMILSKLGYFLRVFELKSKFRHLAMKLKNQQKIIRQLSSCLIEKYNGFTIISIDYKKK